MYRCTNLRQKQHFVVAQIFIIGIKSCFRILLYNTARKTTVPAEAISLPGTKELYTSEKKSDYNGNSINAVQLWLSPHPSGRGLLSSDRLPGASTSNVSSALLTPIIPVAAQASVVTVGVCK